MCKLEKKTEIVQKSRKSRLTTWEPKYCKYGFGLDVMEGAWSYLGIVLGEQGPHVLLEQLVGGQVLEVSLRVLNVNICESKRLTHLLHRGHTCGNDASVKHEDIQLQ